MSIRDDIQRLKKATEKRGALKRLAEAADVPYTTAIRLVRNGEDINAIRSIQALIEALNAAEAVEGGSGLDDGADDLPEAA